MTQVELEMLQLLVDIESEGSLGAAARAQRISQPAASQRLRRLESAWGLTLVTRSPRGSTLTDDGKTVCAWAHVVLHEVAQLTNGVAALRGRRESTLKVAASLTVAEYLVPRWLGELHRAYPDIRPGLTVVNSSGVVELVSTGSVGLGFIETATRPKGLKIRRVGIDRLVVVVRHGHRWARRRGAVGLDELAATELVVREPGSGTRDTFERALGCTPPIALEASSTHVLIGAAVNNVGPAVLSELAVRDLVRAGVLVEVDVDIDLRRPLSAVWRSGETLTSAAHELVRIAASR